MYLKIETECLLYIRVNQTKLRSEEYINSHNAVVDDGNVNPNELEKMVLPVTVIGNQQHMLKMQLNVFVLMSAQICSLKFFAILRGME